MDVKKLIFDLYKDDVIISKEFKRHVKEKFNLDSREAHDIFVMIANYQIKKYGKGLEVDDGMYYIPREDIEHARVNSNSRKYNRRNKGRWFRWGYGIISWFQFYQRRCW